MNDDQIRDAKARAWDEVKRLVTEAAAIVRSKVPREMRSEDVLRSTVAPSSRPSRMPPLAHLRNQIKAEMLELVRDSMVAVETVESTYRQQLEKLKRLAEEQDD